MIEAIGAANVTDLDSLQIILTNVNKQYMKMGLGKTDKTAGPWNSDMLKDLLRQRRNAIGEERRILSKRIQKEMRREMWKIRSSETWKILGEFKDMK